MNVIELERRTTKRRNKDSLQTEAKKAVRSLIITLSTMIIVLLIAFLITTNDNAQRGYTLKQEQLKNDLLKNTQENLENKIVRTKANENLEQNQKFKTMQEEETKTFVTKEDNTVK